MEQGRRPGPVEAGVYYTFGPFTLDFAAGELRHEGRLRKLQEQPLRLLTALITRPGRLVSREELIGELWPDSVVDYERGLNTAMRRIRRALRDSASDPEWIATVPRRGYRFIGAVSVVRGEAEPEGVDAERVGRAALVRQGRWGWGRRGGPAVMAAVMVAMTLFSGGPVVNTPHTPETPGRESGLVGEVAELLGVLPPCDWCRDRVTRTGRLYDCDWCIKRLDKRNGQ